MTKVLSVYKRMQILREKYFSLVTGKESLIQIINDSEVAEQVYNSNAIENSTLSLEETEKILLQIDLDRYITERELFEVKNLARVVSYIDKKAPEKSLSLELILLFHQMLLSNIRDDIAGRFRQDGEYVRVANHIAPPPTEILNMMNEIINYYHISNQENIIKRIATIHLKFEYTHPFVDGNGRIGRVINNFLLIREGYVPINIAFVDRKKYYDALREFDVKGQTKLMEEIVGRALANSYHKRLAYLEGKTIMSLTAYSKKLKLSHSNLINKANRQTIEAFSEKGVWKIGV